MKKNLTEAIKITGKVADNWLPLKIQFDHTPGAVVCIAVAGKPKYCKAFGYADVENEIPMKTDSLFRVASMSKMFTAVAIMQLQEAGKLRLDDRVSEYLPWFKGKSKQTDLTNVTIRQLLSHNAGIFRDGAAGQWWSDKFPKSVTKTMSSHSIVFENGTTFKYSNHGFAILGALIEKVSGVYYSEYTTKHIITPLGLKHTHPDLPEEVPKNLAIGYERRVPGKATREREPHTKTNAYAAATGFISTAKDIAAFLASLNLDAKNSVLSRESRKEMMRVQNILENDEMYGIGLHRDKIAGQDTYGHSGGFAGFVTDAIAEPKDNVQIIVLTNTLSGTADRATGAFLSTLKKFQQESDVEYVADDPYSGTYRCRWGDVTIVSVGKNLLGFSAATNNPVEPWDLLTPKRKHVFVDTQEKGYSAVGEQLQFKDIKNGKAGKLISDEMVLERIN